MNRSVLSPDRKRRLERNPRLLFWSAAFRELQAFNAFASIFYLTRGVGDDELFYLSIFYSIATLVLEVPSGYIADAIGRKRTMQLGGLFFVACYVVLFFAHGFWLFAASSMLLSAGFAMISGAEDALLYDTLGELDRQTETTHHNGRLISARHILKIFIPAIAAFVARDLTEAQFAIVIGMDVLIKLVSLGILSGLIEPHVSLKLGPGVMREMMHTLRRSPHLLRLSANRWLVFSAGFVMWRAYQPHLQEVGSSMVGLGVFYVLMHLEGLLTKWHTSWIQRKLSPRVLLVWFPVVGFLLLLPAAWSESLIVRFVCLLGAFAFIYMRTPLFLHMFHHHIESRSRATTQSVLNLIKPLLDIPLLLAAGLVAKIYGWSGVLLLTASVGILALGLFRIKMTDYMFTKTPPRR